MDLPLDEVRSEMVGALSCLSEWLFLREAVFLAPWSEDFPLEVHAEVVRRGASTCWPG